MDLTSRTLARNFVRARGAPDETETPGRIGKIRIKTGETDGRLAETSLIWPSEIGEVQWRNRVVPVVLRAASRGSDGRAEDQPGEANRESPSS